jgi:hypothetical protein
MFGKIQFTMSFAILSSTKSNKNKTHKNTNMYTNYGQFVTKPTFGNQTQF